MRSRSSTEPRAPPASRGGSLIVAIRRAAITSVTAATPQSVARQPKAVAAQASGAEPAILPKVPSPMTSPANVPKAAGGYIRARMK